MTATHLTGPLVVGTLATTTSAGGATVVGGNQGSVELVQTMTITRDATLVQTASVILPKNAQILDFIIDEDVAYDSATSATLTIGTAAAGTQYVTSVNAKTGGRVAATHTAAQTLVMKDIGTTNLTVYGTVTSVGQPTVGTVRVSVRYVQR